LGGISLEAHFLLINKTKLKLVQQRHNWHNIKLAKKHPLLSSKYSQHVIGSNEAHREAARPLPWGKGANAPVRAMVKQLTEVSVPN
jgi:hypothetical protein